MTTEELRSQVDALEAEVAELSTIDNITPEQDERLDAALAERKQRKGELAAAEAEEQRIAARDAETAEIRDGLASKKVTGTPSAPNFNRPSDVYDYDVRSLRDAGEARERVMRVLDDSNVTKYLPEQTRASVLEEIERQISTPDVEAHDSRKLKNNMAQKFLATMRPEYIRGYAKKMTGFNEITPEEQRAMDEARAWSDANDSTTIPELFDPQLGLNNAGAVNPMRQLGTIKRGTADIWEGLNTTGITASWDGEAVEVSDDDPAFTRPTITAYKGAAFVPWSVEFGGDAAAIVGELGMLFADAKERLESAAFATGNGSTAPKGILTALTAVTYSSITPTTDGQFGVEDTYKLMNTLSPRWRPNSAFVGSISAQNRIRAFGTALGASFITDLSGGYTFTLLGRPFYEDSDYANVSTLTTGALNIMTFGDHSKYYIYDRVGMSTEFIPMLFSTGSGRPTGQRGVYAWWRTGADMFFVGATPPVLLLQNT